MKTVKPKKKNQKEKVLRLSIEVNQQNVIDLVESGVLGSQYLKLDWKKSNIDAVADLPGGGFIEFEDLYSLEEKGAETATKHRLTWFKVLHALQLMQTEAPACFSDFLADNTDALTGDVLLQLALFGKVIYG